MKRLLEISVLLAQLGTYSITLYREWLKLQQDLGLQPQTNLRGVVEGMHEIGDFANQLFEQFKQQQQG